MSQLRARIAVKLLDWARALLCVQPKDGLDLDTCAECGAEGFEYGEGEHRPDCSGSTGLRTVTLPDLWPDGPCVCDRCGTELWPGDTEALIPTGPSLYEVACVGCSVLAGIAEEGS